jgi:protein disulfide-isomerase A1
VLVLGYFKDFKGDEYDAFIKVAQKAEDVAFAQTKSADAAKAAELSAPGVVIVTNFEGEGRGTAVLKGKITEEALDEHVKAEKLPPTIVFNDKNSQKIFGAGIERQLLLVANAKDLKPDAKVFKAFRAAATAHKGKLVFVTVDLDGTSKDPVVNFFGIKEEDAPVIVGFEMNANKKYKLTEAINEKSVAKFAEGMSAGTLTPEYKSAAIPDEPLDGGVTVIVGKNFDKIVKDADKDVLLEVYAPWCGHCKTLEPIYKKLAKRLAKVDSVVIAKMDGTENEHPDVDVKGFPTIILFPAGKGAAPIPYEGGDRSLKSLTKFLKKNAAKSFELPKKGKDSKEEEEEAAAEAEEAEVKDEL